MSKKAVPPLFSSLDLRTRIPLADAAQAAGFSVGTMRGYFKRGLIEGARQVGHHQRWTVDRDSLERWWQAFNSGNAKKV